MVCYTSDRCTVLAFEGMKAGLRVDSSDDAAKSEPFGDQWGEEVAQQEEEEEEEGSSRGEGAVGRDRGIGQRLRVLRSSQVVLGEGHLKGLRR